MTKRMLSCLTLLALLFSAALSHTAAAATLHELTNCRRVFSYSGSSAAYFYGFYGNTLVSSRVIPDTITRMVDVPGNILCACHDDANAYALYRESLHTYKVVQMNMNSGACTYIEVAQGRTVQHTSLAASNGEVFVIITDNASTNVLGTREKQENLYRFSYTVNRLFVSGNAAYALLDNGAVYRIGGGQSAAVSGISPGDSATTVSANGKTATLQADCSVTIHDNASFQEELPDGACAPDSILNVVAGTTVSQLRAQRGASLLVLDANGNTVGSGALRTGYSARLGNQTLLLAVSGDVNGSSTVNSADVTMLMQHFTGSISLSAVALCAADCNNDGNTDLRDLVLLARAAA